MPRKLSALCHHLMKIYGKVGLLISFHEDLPRIWGIITLKQASNGPPLTGGSYLERGSTET